MLAQVIFYALAALTVGSAMLVAFSRNIVYSTFALLGAFMGVVGIYILLAADFVAMVQLLVYVGGILVLTIFAVMLTAGIGDVTVSNRAVGTGAAIFTVGIVGAGDVVRDRADAMASGGGSRARADHLRNRKRVPGRVRAAVRGRVAGAVGRANRRDSNFAPRGAGVGEREIGMGGGITLNHFLVLSLIVFSLGLFTVLTRRNAIGILMGVELILNSANINYLAFSFYGGGKYDGQIFAIFVIMLAAAEAVIGLAVVLAIYQNFKTIDVDATETLRG